MKKIINLKKVKKADLGKIFAKQMQTAYAIPKDVPVRHLELAVRSLNLQRMP